MKKLLGLILILMLVISCAPAANKSEEGARKGTAIGALVGAGLGQAIGGDTKATLISMGIGAIVGGFTGKKIGQNMDEQEAANIQRNAEILAITFKSAVLKPGADSEIQRVSTVLNQYPQTRIWVAGHTDSTGSEQHNQELSERRAMSVKTVLVSQGVHPARVQNIGFGEQAPVADNGSESGRQLNRRVVVTISPQES